MLLDGEFAGTLAPRGELRQEIGRGDHVVDVRVDWCGSQPMRFTATGHHRIVVQSALRGWRLVLTPVFILISRRSYLTLDLDPAEAG
ncbi:MAG: hypothetical protein AB7O97_03940 [Planctomycetota bacterium]